MKTIIYGWSKITYDNLGIIDYDIRSEDEAAMRPVLESLQSVTWEAPQPSQ
jgi:hypothetical protein